jgi:hypothetical protein
VATGRSGWSLFGEIQLVVIIGSPLGGPHSIRGVGGLVASAALYRITGASL